MTTRAIMRGVAATFADALAAARPEPPIDVARARAQHRAHVDALGELGVEPAMLEADEACSRSHPKRPPAAPV